LFHSAAFCDKLEPCVETYTPLIDEQEKENTRNGSHTGSLIAALVVPDEGQEDGKNNDLVERFVRGLASVFFSPYDRQA
jgi:hypothetical protein